MAINMGLDKTDYSLKIAGLYNEIKATLISSSPEILNVQRQKAFANFINLGLPTTKNEDYKYTNIQPLFSDDYQFSHVADEEIPMSFVENIIPQIDPLTIYLKNGTFLDRNSLGQFPGGIVAKSLKEAAGQKYHLLEKYYNHLAVDSDDSFAALNTAMAADGFYISVEKKHHVINSLQVVNLSDSNSGSFFTQRNLVVVGAGAKANLLICDITSGVNKNFANQLTEIVLEENAAAEIVFYRNQPNEEACVNSVFVKQEKNSAIKIYTINLHAGFVRNNLTIDLEGENCETSLYGMAFTDKNQHVDNFIRVNHSKPHCNSFQLYKNVLDGQSTGAFAGRIHVQRNAQKTNAFQRNNNLVLTDQAKMHTKPQLIIDADDVKCSHGATVGQIDQEALFYLRSRGIPEKEARVMMTHAFTFEVLQEIKSEELRNNLGRLIEKRLGEGFGE